MLKWLNHLSRQYLGYFGINNVLTTILIDMGNTGIRWALRKRFQKTFRPIRMLHLNWKVWMYLWYLDDHEMIKINYMHWNS